MKGTGISHSLTVIVVRRACMHFWYDTNGSVPGGKRDVVIDGGGKDGYNIGKKVLKPYFLKSGAGRVELAYATHLHTDHFKGLEELAAEGMIDKLVTRGRTGDIVKFAGSSGNRIEIIYPDVQDPNAEDENLNSLIFKVHIEGVTVLITGDLGEEGERILLEKYRGTDVLDCDILKVCHHGSRFSSCMEFLEAVSPRIALIGVGEDNTYGHPAGEVIERIEEAGAKVYRTDRDGAIGIDISNEGAMTVQTYK